MRTIYLFIFILAFLFSSSQSSSQAGINNPSGTIGANNFHSTQGNIEVTGGGQLQYTLPINLPKGIKDVSPNIAITYSSNSSNGIAGYGWNISGITAITRSGKSIEKDGVLESIKLNNSDYYTFNGQRLLLKSGIYGADGAEYVTEKYSNIKIKSVGSISNTNWSGPNYWEITFEDGSQATYGSVNNITNPATTPVEYNIMKWVDAQGNHISYIYEQSGNVSIIKHIMWGGNKVLNKPHINEIAFNYISRDFKEGSYVDGEYFIQNNLLSSIEVKTNNTQFKRYAINYFKNGSNYQLVNSITEFNASNEAAKPVTFTYPTLTPTTAQYNILPNNIDPFENVKFTGDFNGDSYLDFIMANGNVKLGAFNDNFTTIPTTKVFDSKAQIVNTLLDEQGQIYSGNGVVQYENGKILGYIFRNNNFEKVFEKQVYTPKPQCNCPITYDLQEADIDGDGIANLLLSIKMICPPPLNPCNPNVTNQPPCISTQPEGGQTNNSEKTGDPTILLCETETNYFVVDLKDASLSVADFQFGQNGFRSYNEKFLDVDADGKVESISITNNSYTVFEYQKVGNIYYKQVKFVGNLLEAKDPEFPILYGDFNGDGKLDYTIPITDNLSIDNWRFYIGTGNGFSTYVKNSFLLYRKRQTQSSSNYNKFTKQDFYSIADINKDGKSDIVHIFSYNQINLQTWSERNFGYVISTRLANNVDYNGNVDFIPTLTAQSPNYATNNLYDQRLFTPLTNPIKSNNNLYDIFLYWDRYLHKLKSQTSQSELSRINSITQGDLTTNILYKELNPTTNPNFYRKDKNEFYPYFSIRRVDQSYAVSQLVQGTRKQDFRYRGMSGHLLGRGILGFLQTARSSWYADGFENTKIWSGIETDPQMYSLPTKEWSIKTNDENQIFPANITIGNTQLISLKLTNYSTQTLANGVEVILPQTVTEKDFLKNNTSVSTITYGNYYLPQLTEININNNFAKKTSELHYIHNVGGIGSNYFVGRPEWKEDIVYAYGDVSKSKETYTFSNNLLESLTKYNKDNSGWIKEQYVYDSGATGVGNLTKKTTTNSVDAQTSVAETLYDTTSRFVIKNIDNLGLESNTTYNSWGQILTQTDTFGNTATNIYDTWGKTLKASTNLGGFTNYTYEKLMNGDAKITEYSPDNSVSINYTNKFGQNYKSTVKKFNENGNYISQLSVYDALGRTTQKSEPYKEGNSPAKWNSISYDDNIFPAKVTAISYAGKQIETISSGNITTTTELNGYGRTTSKTTDALGNVVSSSDAGGTINFTYNADGKNLKATYGQNIVTTTYDYWGRKKTFHDPSNGLYSYFYSGLGQTTRIESPKGEKRFVYNSYGQLVSQTETSNDGNTDKQIQFAYNNKGLLINKNGTSNGESYSFDIQYDIYGRAIASSEQSNGNVYTQSDIIFDDVSRVVTYKKTLNTQIAQTQAHIQNIYDTWSGEVKEVKDLTSGKNLWAKYAVNDKGLIIGARLGNTAIQNTYDANDMLSQTVHGNKFDITPILIIDYNFDAIKNELTSRTRGGYYNILESFQYDNNNRLENWTNPVTGQMSNNVYDAKGRITYNDQVGDVKFENSPQIYQASSVDLNQAGQENYTNDLIQSILYNENNDPVFINGEQGDVAFSYGLSGMRQKVNYGGNFEAENTDEARYQKTYSEDGSFEVIFDKNTGEEKHLLYIGGSPYESDIVLIKNYGESTARYHFLHKDYLGSILAVVDDTGIVEEQRHFDAWGNFTHLKIGANAIITGSQVEEYIKESGGLLVDRGYTTHEHYGEVGIIHMNGRLYDPLLRRFLNADENIQDPYNTQNYNKYGYVMNNPLMYSDPSGELFWMAILAGAIIGAVSGAANYIGITVKTGKFNIGGFFKSILGGAVTGAILGAIAPMAIPTGTLGGFALAGFSGAFMPSTSIDLGYGFHLGLSLSLAFGNTMGLGSNFALSYTKGNWHISAGFGISRNSNTGNTGMSFWEKRYSGSIGFDDGKFGLSVYSTTFRGGNINQRIGGAMIRQGDFSFRYENDGMPFNLIKTGDGNDSWRTASAHLGYKQFGIGFNLFTGYRSDYTGDQEKIGKGCYGDYCEFYPNNQVKEVGPRYRMGAIYMNVGNMRMGQDSEYFRHAIQDRWAHDIDNFLLNTQQPGFPMLSNGYNNYIQFQNTNPYTLW